MKKRGQVYILGAVIVGIAIFLIFTTLNIVEQSSLNKKFQRLNENFEREAERFINSYVTNPDPDKAELRDSFATFTRDFSNYARQINPEFGIITTISYVNKEGNQVLVIINMLNTFIFVTDKFHESVITPSIQRDSDVELIEGCAANIGAEIRAVGVGGDLIVSSLNQDCIYEKEFQRNKKILLLIGDIWYSYKVPSENKPELIVVSKSDERAQTQIFSNQKQTDVIDNSKDNKPTCARFCNLNANNENACKPGANLNKIKNKCCTFFDSEEERKYCSDPSSPCCRVDCEIFKNKDTCELQNDEDNIRCCFTVRNRCENSVYDSNLGKFKCE
ncbi:hypothetical protein HY498_02670 [Candidatus Woesearchaeota archaeon]|nr:hypothetical protein [Candidatus Woesearchaeota archaeon]